MNAPNQRTFNLKHGYLIDHPANADVDPGRTIHPGIADDRSGQPLRMAEPGWRPVGHGGGETEQRPEGCVEDDELRAARAWLAHLEAGRIGGGQ